ncbi:MAG: hypothetical protein ACRD3L_06665 [Terriglobales bacterium]
MSDERRKHQQEPETAAQAKTRLQNFMVVVGIVAVFAALYFFVRHKQNSRMDAFAQCLSARGAKMYGAFWCSHCSDQKELFGPSFQYAPYVECGIKGSRNEAQVCSDAGVKRFPTWIFADGVRVEGERPLDFLGQATGCPLP